MNWSLVSSRLAKGQRFSLWTCFFRKSHTTKTLFGGIGRQRAFF